jgi:hypothetical protein
MGTTNDSPPSEPVAKVDGEPATPPKDQLNADLLAFLRT